MINHRVINIKLIVLFFIIISSSCVTNLDLEYIQSSKDMQIPLKQEKSTLQDYRLQRGDLLSVQISTTTEQQHDFFNKENTSNSELMIRNPYLYGYLIKEDGNLDLPSLGIVKAAGFTLRELEKIIKNIAVSYFERPVVKLNIINFEITVLGEVNKPGTFKIVDPQVNILYALSLAGDITQFGDRRRVKIIRNKDELNRVFYIDLTQINMLNNTDFMLQPHDIIYVAPLRKKFFAFNSVANLITISLSAVTLFLLLNTK